MLRKVESIIFYLFVFCIPFQTRLILTRWPVLRSLSEGGAPVMTGFNEWTSAFLHGTDILIVILLLLWFIRLLHGSSEIKFRKSDIFLGLFFLISALSITASHSKALSSYQLIKLAEFIAFYFYIRANFGKIFDWENLLKVLVLSGFFQAIIAILQYLTQGALGLRLLGESPITPGGPGVASFYVGQQVFLRAYGTFPHPNILATFLMLAIFTFYYLYFTNLESKPNGHFFWRWRLWATTVLNFLIQIVHMRQRVQDGTVGQTSVQEKGIIGRNFLTQRASLLFIYAVMLYALFTTYSRTVIGLMVLSMLAFLVLQMWQGRYLLNKRVYTIVIVSVAVVLLFISFNFHQTVARALISGSDEAVSLRLYYDKIAGQTTGHYPWLGVGIGAFVPKFMRDFSHIPSYYYQPVHNIYLLISAETGILGIVSFLAFLFFLIKNFTKSNNLRDSQKLGLLLVCFTLLAIGLFDHLPWTIQQGRIIFWLTLAFLYEV